jgi:hypothetical protein
MFKYNLFTLTPINPQINDTDDINGNFIRLYLSLGHSLQEDFHTKTDISSASFSQFINMLREATPEQIANFSESLMLRSNYEFTYVTTTMLIFFMEIALPIIQESPLFEKQSLDAIGSFLKINPQAINQASSFGITPFLLAVYYYPIPNSPLVTLLIDFKAHTRFLFDTQTLPRYLTPIYQAYKKYTEYNPLKHEAELRNTTSNPNEYNLLTVVERNLSSKISATEWLITQEFTKLQNYNPENKVIPFAPINGVNNTNIPELSSSHLSTSIDKNNINTKTMNPLKDYSIITPLQDVPTNAMPFERPSTPKNQLPVSHQETIFQSLPNACKESYESSTTDLASNSSERNISDGTITFIPARSSLEIEKPNESLISRTKLTEKLKRFITLW